MYHWQSSVIPISFIRSVFLYQIAIVCRRDMRKSSPINWMNLEESEEHWDRKRQISTRTHSHADCLTPVPDSPVFCLTQGLLRWAKWSILSPGVHLADRGLLVCESSHNVQDQKPNQALNPVVSLSHLAMQVHSIPFETMNQSTVHSFQKKRMP